MDTRLSLDQRIDATPGVCGGKPHIAGHRIRVQDVVAWSEFQGMTPDEIVSGYPQITLADVHAALGYYHTHREEVQQQISEDEAFVERLRQLSPRSSQGSPGTDADDHPHSS